MKKTVILKLFLVLFPVLAVALATTSDSVTVFSVATGETQYFSYFDVLPIGDFSMVTPLTAMLSALSGVLAAVYMAKKNPAVLKYVSYAALASAALAAVPMIRREEFLVIPNAALPIFMMLEYGVAYFLQKSAPDKAPKTKTPRLNRK